MAHITGGGFIDNIPRVLPGGLGARVRRDAWKVPPLFRLIQNLGNVSETEMYRVFNMGIGYIVIASPENAADIEAALDSSGENVCRIGEVIEGSGVSLV
jgi:phosphoribosylformylglycinamidine cyclo-ligase